MILRSLTVLSVLLATFTAAIAEEPAPFFPVMAWNSCPNDPAEFKRMRECGFTVAGFVAPAGLDACHAADLKAIVSDARSVGYDWTAVDPKVARENITKLIGEVRNHPAVYGYNLRDEPPAAFFSGLATVSSVVKELHPGAWPYINLFPNYANAGQLGTPDYDSYVEKFVEVCQPPILSYDHYAIYEGGKFRPEYFTNLESMRRAAIKHKLHFWQIVLSLGALNFRVPDSADLHFQVYTSLAYGARGLAWFCYFTPPLGNFRNGPIDQFGNKTPTWGAMRQVNLQIKKLAPTLLKLTSDRVYHFGEIPPGCTGPDENSLVSAIHGNILVGDFTHEDGTRYVMIVNKSFTDSTFSYPQFREPVKALQQVSQYHGQLVPFEGEYVWLGPGQGALLKITR